jgi:hypothetical protein
VKVSSFFWVSLCVVILLNGKRIGQTIAESEYAKNEQSLFYERQQRDKENEREVLRRARTCLLIDERFPLVEGARAFYDPTKRVSTRLLPDGTTLCSKDSGYTAIVRDGLITSVRSAPVEQLRRIIRDRGL